MELGSYQERVIVNYQENTLRGTVVQASFLHDKMVVFLSISCSISKLLTRNTRKNHCVYYPLVHDSYGTLSSSNTQWTCQPDFLGINYMYIPVEGWDNISEKSSQIVRYRPYRNLFSIFLTSLILTKCLSPSMQFCKDFSSMPHTQWYRDHGQRVSDFHDKSIFFCTQSTFGGSHPSCPPRMERGQVSSKVFLACSLAGSKYVKKGPLCLRLDQLNHFMPCKGIMQLLPSKQQCPGNFNITSEGSTWLLRWLRAGSNFLCTHHYRNNNTGWSQSCIFSVLQGLELVQGDKRLGMAFPLFWGCLGSEVMARAKAHLALPFFLWSGLC